MRLINPGSGVTYYKIRGGKLGVGVRIIHVVQFLWPLRGENI